MNYSKYELNSMDIKELNELSMLTQLRVKQFKTLIKNITDPKAQYEVNKSLRDERRYSILIRKVLADKHNFNAKANKERPKPVTKIFKADIEPIEKYYEYLNILHKLSLDELKDLSNMIKVKASRHVKFQRTLKKKSEEKKFAVVLYNEMIKCIRAIDKKIKLLERK